MRLLAHLGSTVLPFIAASTLLGPTIAAASSLARNHHSRESHQLKLSVPPVSEASTPLPPSFQSLSIEFQFFPSYTGNQSDPNEFSLSLFRSLDEVGDPMYIRIGGSTEDRVYYDASFPQAIESFFDFSWESNPYNGTMGPSFFDGIALLPQGQRYVFGVNEGGFNNSQGTHSQRITMDNIVNQVKAAWAAMRDGDKLWAIETGNEMSGFNYSYQGVWYRDPNDRWNQADFVREDFNTTYELCQGPVLPGAPHEDQSRNPLWRAGDLSGFKPGAWTFQGAWKLGQNAWHRLREYSVHLYPATMCAASLGAEVTIANTMLNHALSAETLEPMRPYAAYTAEQGVEFVIGECNSVSCSGKPGVSDSFSAALWAFDWAMYAASLGVKRIYYHNGPGFPYSGIWPTEINGTEPCVRSEYYGYVMNSLAAGSTKLGTSGKRVVNLINETSIAGYALYWSPSWTPSPPQWYHVDGDDSYPNDDRSQEANSNDWHVSDLALLNLREFNQTEPSSARGQLTFNIGSEWNGARITRLTAPGSDTLPITKGRAPWRESKKQEGPISVGCMTYTSGRPERIDGCTDEIVQGDTITVKDSEAVLVSKDVKQHRR